MADLREHGLVPLAGMREGLAHAAKGVPLCAADGTVKAFAMVDAEDHPVLSQHRWCLKDGYAVRWSGPRTNRLQHRMHRVVLGLENDDPRHGDHINRDRLDNRRANLRPLAEAVHHQNVSAHRDAVSRHRGVYWDASRGKWVAAAQVDKKKVHIGRFDDEQDAADAAAAWRRRHMPFSND